MVLNQNEYTMASLGFNYQKPSLFLPNQTRPPSFLINKNRTPPPPSEPERASHSSSLHFLLFPTPTHTLIRLPWSIKLSDFCCSSSLLLLYLRRSPLPFTIYPFSSHQPYTNLALYLHKASHFCFIFHSSS